LVVALAVCLAAAGGSHALAVPGDADNGTANAAAEETTAARWKVPNSM
jgi:hypothetical protein